MMDPATILYGFDNFKGIMWSLFGSFILAGIFIWAVISCNHNPNPSHSNTIEVHYLTGKTDTITCIADYVYLNKGDLTIDNNHSFGHVISSYVVSFKILNQLK